MITGIDNRSSNSSSVINPLALTSALIVVVGEFMEGGFIVCLDGRGCCGINNVTFIAFNIGRIAV